MKMYLVNVIFGEELNDVDIILVPYKQYLVIETLGQKYCNWLASDKNPNRLVSSRGIPYFDCETAGFIEWLNTNFCHESEKAVIVCEHTMYNPTLRSLNF